ncbi:MAG: tetratricopeptide repeat protein [Ginsengibacter sp.]
MKKLSILFAFVTCFLIGKTQDVKELHETAKGFMRQGDFANATLVLNKALQQQPDNIEITKDLALNYYLQKDNTKALETIKPLLDRNDADDQCFQIAGNIYKALNQLKECEKLYKKGIKKFPQSGSLYNEYGELLWAMQDLSAIKQWEKGIETDPGYSSNYYNATKYYYVTSDKIWSIIYGEIFVNIESLTGRTAEIKTLLLDSYKKIFADADIFKNAKEKNNFEQAFLQTLYKQNTIAASGINPETLTMIRTRFILDWLNGFSAKFPFRLFEFQLQLLREGMFDAYNQWLFGAVQNLVAYQNWTSAHALEYDEFSKFQKGRIFKIPSKQYYHKTTSAR